MKKLFILTAITLSSAFAQAGAGSHLAPIGINVRGEDAFKLARQIQETNGKNTAGAMVTCEGNSCVVSDGGKITFRIRNNNNLISQLHYADLNGQIPSVEIICNQTGNLTSCTISVTFL